MKWECSFNYGITILFMWCTLVQLVIPKYQTAVLVRYLRICCNYQDFVYRSELLTTRLLRQGYVYQKLCAPLCTATPIPYRSTGGALKILLLNALPYLLFNTCSLLSWHIYAHTAFKHTLFALHCLPCTLLAISTSGTSSTSVCACAHTCVYAPITRDDNDYDRYARSLNERQLHKEQLHKEQLHEEMGLSRSLYQLLNKASHLTAFCA